jgi:hypothetical protein
VTVHPPCSPACLARAAGLSTHTVRRFIRSKALRALSVGVTGARRPSYRIRYTDAVAFLVERGMAPEEAEAALS